MFLALNIEQAVEDINISMENFWNNFFVNNIKVGKKCILKRSYIYSFNK